MKKNILVRTKSLLCEGDEHSEPSLLCTSGNGSCHEKGGALWMRYVETPSGEETVMNRLHLSAGRITVRRSGALSSELTFVPGEVTQGVYVTSCGRLLFDIDTRLAEWATDESGIRIRLSYTIRQGGQLLSECEMRIEAVYQ